jgi:phosphoglycerate kinase
MVRPRYLAELPLEGKRVLVRVDFNVPLDEAGAITDDTRIRASLPTIRAILKARARPILMSHLGRPKGVDEKARLAPIGSRLEQLLGSPVVSLRDSAGPEVAAAIAKAKGNATVLLENVRFQPGETKGDMELARRYAELGDVFINDAFGSSHRDHASVCGVARLLPSAAGLLLQKELEAFERLDRAEKPFVAILGGAKVADKLPVIENLLPRVQAVLIGGAMAYTFLSAKGHSIGASRFESEQVETVRKTLAAAASKQVDILLPTDHVVADRFAEDAAKKTTPAVDIPEGFLGLDIGPSTVRRYAERIRSARTIVWNGPMGVFEMEPFRAGTAAVAKAVAESSGYSVVGGGDSVAAIELLGLADRIDHVSTGGGASLELLAGVDLPGIAVLRERA